MQRLITEEKEVGKEEPRARVFVGGVYSESGLLEIRLFLLSV